MVDVVQVKLTHFAGERPKLPAFPLVEQAAPTVSVVEDEAAAMLTSGRLTVRVARGDGWRVEFRGDDRVITASEFRSMGIVEVENEGTFIHEQPSLAVGECVYGLGERFTAFVKNGQVVDSWNRDGGTGSEQAYKNVPFYLTNRGYGVFVNHPELVSFEVADRKSV